MTAENATIESTYLGGWDESIPTEGVLVIGLMFSGDAWGQGSGFYSGQIPGFVAGVLKALAVSSWEKLPGTLCRVRRENGRIAAVGHYMKDQWFTFSALYDKENVRA